MKPATYRDAYPEKCCGTCRFSHRVAPFLDLLCFFGDEIEVSGVSEYPVKSEFVELNGRSIYGMDDETYSGDVWAGRIISDDGICDCWQEAEQEKP